MHKRLGLAYDVGLRPEERVDDRREEAVEPAKRPVKRRAEGGGEVEGVQEGGRAVSVTTGSSHERGSMHMRSPIIASHGSERPTPRRLRRRPLSSAPGHVLGQPRPHLQRRGEEVVKPPIVVALRAGAPPVALPSKSMSTARPVSTPSASADTSTRSRLHSWQHGFTTRSAAAASRAL